QGRRLSRKMRLSRAPSREQTRGFPEASGPSPGWGGPMLRDLRSRKLIGALGGELALKVLLHGALRDLQPRGAPGGVVVLRAEDGSLSGFDGGVPDVDQALAARERVTNGGVERRVGPVLGLAAVLFELVLWQGADRDGAGPDVPRREPHHDVPQLPH